MKDRCRGFLIGTAIGDAMGVALEGLPPIEDIPHKEFWKGFIPLPEDINAYPGMTSDDTQLTSLTMLSLHVKNGFNSEHLASLFSKEFESNRTEGWGLSTIGSIGKIVYEGISWEDCGSPEGSAGNGAAMRAGPFGLFPWKTKKEMIYATMRASRITHKDKDACGGAVAIAVANHFLLNCNDFECREFCNAIIREVRPHSKKMADLLKNIFENDDMSSAIEKLAKMGDSPENPQTGKRGISGYVLPSVAVALYIFKFFSKDPVEAMGQAMLAGGDTDTVGSMIGGLLGTLNGEKIWPEHLSTNIQNYNDLLVIADSFAKTCWEVSESYK